MPMPRGAGVGGEDLARRALAQEGGDLGGRERGGEGACGLAVRGAAVLLEQAQQQLVRAVLVAGLGVAGEVLGLGERGSSEMPPLSEIARWNSPFASGDWSSVKVLRPPADSPNTVTRAGSPPNAAMFAFTQRSASIRSSVPKLPDWSAALAPASARSAACRSQPKGPMRYCTATTITPCSAAR